MTFVRTFEGFRPSPRADSVAWDRVRIGEGTLEAGPFTELEVQALSPLDLDPSDPVRRSFTTTLATLEEGWYELVFLDPSDLEDEPILVHYPVPYGYPTTSELLAQTTCDELLALQEDQQEALRLAAIVGVESWCGQRFTYDENETVEVECQGGYELYLPKRLISLTSASLYGGDPLELGPIAVDPEGDRIVFRRQAVGVGYYEQALYEVSGGDYATGLPYGTLSLTGNWGWETAPDAVQTALRYDMEEQALADANALASTVHAFRRLGLAGVGQGTLRAQLVTPPTLSPRVERLLVDYVWMGTGGRLV
jgi:hypothetical protein